MYDISPLPTCSTHLITSADIPQRHCANHTGNASSWKTFRQYGIQSLFSADFICWHIVYTRSQVGTLCESPTTRNVYGYVKYSFALNKQSMLMLWYSANGSHHPGRVHPSRSERMDIPKCSRCLSSKSDIAIDVST